MKRVWNTPSSVVEGFEANEYVAACWAVACQGGCHANSNSPQDELDHEYNDRWADAENSDGDHRGSCTDGLRNRVVVDADGHITIAENSIDQGWLEADWMSYYDDLNGDGMLDAGDRAYWTTKASDGRTWNHAGILYSVDAYRPNHS